jgi:hypothetical protein
MSSSTLVVDAAGPTGGALQGARHRPHLQNSVVDAAGSVGNALRGITIDVLQQLVVIVSIHYKRLLGDHW